MLSIFVLLNAYSPIYVNPFGSVTSFKLLLLLKAYAPIVLKSFENEISFRV